MQSFYIDSSDEQLVLVTEAHAETTLLIAAALDLLRPGGPPEG